ncbi:MAG: hypothetical protein R3327_01385 [Nitrosopumilaceae archaeon]|nr:hypothetical protein [Nitrosopumilaceae archaeon]
MVVRFRVSNRASKQIQNFTDCEFCGITLLHCHCKCPYCGERDKCTCACGDAATGG